MTVTRVARRPTAKPPATKAAPKRPASRTKPAPKRATDNFRASAARSFDLARTLDAAARIRRGKGPEGSEALLTPAERARVTELFGTLPPAKARALTHLLTTLPEGAPQTLLLKGAAARAGRLASDTRAFTVLEGFAKVLAPLSVEAMLERATVLDLDSRQSTSSADPMQYWDKRGTIRERPSDGAATDNDGLFQRFTASCGPTVIQMMRAQADPVLAFALNAEDRSRDASTGDAANFQRALLEEYGGIAVGRRESYVLSRIHNALARLGLEGGLSQGNIAKMRARYDGFPSDADLERVKRVQLPPHDSGIAVDDFKRMLDLYVGRLTGARYTQTSPPEGFARGQAWRHLDTAERTLKRGDDVPFGTCEPAHWMLMTAVKGTAPKREFLVSDPDGGRTAWVKEKALVDGSFGDKQFHLPKPHERTYVDCFFFPK